jgi:hypothetical protein
MTGLIGTEPLGGDELVPDSEDAEDIEDDDAPQLPEDKDPEDVGEGRRTKAERDPVLRPTAARRSSTSGLSRLHRRRARQLAVQAALLGLNHRVDLHYTQGARRWDGIAHGLQAGRGKFPYYTDCSAFATWCLWNGLSQYNVRDVVNGLGWRAGFTGTMLSHGRRVPTIGGILTGDLVLYGGHVAVIVGRRGGVPMVVSMGSERGPFYLRWNYRRVQAVRRYV